MNCLKIRANVYKDWLALLSGDLACNADALRELPGMRDGTLVSVLSFDETRNFIDDICLNGVFTSLHHISPSSYLLIFDFLICSNLLLFSVITCVFICLFTLTHMWLLSVCFIVAYLLVNHLQIKIYMYKVWDEINYRFPNINPNFNGAAVEVWEWIITFIPHFIMVIMTYPCRY